ncbi:MAG TPA: hypothetical protein VKD00_07060 [Methyloceanibacter sp.]|nr:hypothetical protein [Methyloceanibacter sp.]
MTYKRDDGHSMDSPVSAIMPSGSPVIYPRLPFSKVDEPPLPEVRIGKDRFRVTLDGVVVYYDEWSNSWKVSIYQKGIIAPLHKLLLDAFHATRRHRRGADHVRR